jgi:hypothetical protein
MGLALVGRSCAGDGGNFLCNALQLLRCIDGSKAEFIVFLLEKGVPGIAFGDPARLETLRVKPPRLHPEAACCVS